MASGMKDVSAVQGSSAPRRHLPQLAPKPQEYAEMQLVSSAQTAPAVPQADADPRRGRKRQMGRQEERRERGVRDGPGGEVETRTNSSTEPQRRQPKRKHRKGLHALRKEEIEQLLGEVTTLQAKIKDLKKAAALEATKPRAERSWPRRDALRQGISYHQEKFCAALGVLSDVTLSNIQAGSPLQERICLRMDRQSRQQTLEALMAKKFKKARRFLRHRCAKLDPGKSVSEDQYYEAENGDLYSARFSISQFRGMASVKQVFDLLTFYFGHVEISVSENLNIVTVRENDDIIHNGIAQNRLVSTTGKGIAMESNTIMFSQYWANGYSGDTSTSDEGGDSGYGLIVADFVDQDEQYPYQPRRRVRKDVNAVMEIRACMRPPEISTPGNTDLEMVVVLTRWVQNRVHSPKFAVAIEGWYELAQLMDTWGQIMHRTLRDHLYSQSSVT